MLTKKKSAYKKSITLIQNFIQSREESTEMCQNAAWSFVQIQLLTMAKDCLRCSREKRINSQYFLKLSESISALVEEVRSFDIFNIWVAKNLESWKKNVEFNSLGKKIWKNGNLRIFEKT